MGDDPRVREVLRCFFSELERPNETWAHKSKQTFFSWGACTFVTSSMIAIPGFRAAAQSRKENVSMELVKRVRYQLENLQSPLKEAVVFERPHPSHGARVISVCGEERESSFWALPEGGDQWRFEQLTLAILDELTYNRNAYASYTAALSAAEGGGKVLVIFTGVYNSWPNREAIAMLKRAHQVA